MVWKQASDACAGTSVIYGAPDIVKISQLFSDTDISDTVTIHESSTWTFQSTCAGVSAFRLRNPAQDFNYLFNTSAIVASRTITLPLLTGNDTLVFECHCQTLTNKTFVAPALGTPASGVMTNVTGTAAGLTAGNVTTNADLTGDVTSCGNATTIANNAVDTVMIADSQVTFAKIQDVSATNRILGRDTACPGVIEEITPANVRTMINVECGSTADQTNAEIKTAYEANACTNEFDDTEQTKLAGIECCAKNDQAIAELTDVTVMCLANCDVIKRVACAWVNAPDAGGGGGICAVVCDTTPELGGDLDTLTNAIVFGVDTTDPAGTVPYINNDACGIQYNVPSCDSHDFLVNNVSQLLVNVCSVDFQANALIDGTLDLADIAVTGSAAEFNTALQSESFVYQTSAQCITGNKRFGTGNLRIADSCGCFSYIFNGANIAADRTITMPLLAGNDTLVTEAFAQALTNKTIDTACNTITVVSADVSDLASSTVTWTNKTFDANATGNSLSNVDVADLANGTDGELITWSACAVATTVGAGCCGQVLTSGGAGSVPAFAASPAADNLGNHTATCTLDLNTQTLLFNAGQTIIGDAGGLTHVVPACDTHEFNRCVNLTAGTVQEGGTDISPVGTHTQWIPAGAWGTVTTNGAAFVELELATNDIMLQTFNFDTCTAEKIQFWWEPPAEWDVSEGILFNVKWTETGGAACGTVVFELSGHSYTDSDAIDAAIGGTPATSTDTNHNVDNDMQISPCSSAVTINGATKGEAVLLQIQRVVACDTLDVDAKLIGVNITYTIDEATKD